MRELVLAGVSDRVLVAEARIAMLRTLGELAVRDRATAPVLRRLLRDESERVRVALVDVLKKGKTAQ